MGPHGLSQFCWAVRVIFPPSIITVDQSSYAFTEKHDTKFAFARNRLEDSLGLQVLAVKVYGDSAVDPAFLEIYTVPNISAYANPVSLASLESKRFEKAI